MNSNALKSLFGWSLARALHPARLLSLVLVLLLVSLLRGGAGTFADGRDLAGVQIAWFGWAVCMVIFAAPAASWGARWRTSERHWVGARLASSNTWFRTAFLAQVCALGVGFALLVAVLGATSTASRPATKRVTTRSIEKLVLTSHNVDAAITFERINTPGVLVLQLQAVGGTGSDPVVRLTPRNADRKQAPVDVTLTGRTRIEIPVSDSVDAIGLARQSGSALIVSQNEPLALFSASAPSWQVYGWLFLTLWIWSILPLGVLHALGVHMRPGLAVGIAVALGVLASSIGLAPFQTLLQALALFEWHAFDPKLVAGELPRALPGLLLGFFQIPGTSSDHAQSDDV